MGQRMIPHGYFSEETVRHLRPRYGLGYKHRMWALEAMLACQLKLTNGRSAALVGDFAYHWQGVGKYMASSRACEILARC